MLLGFVVFLAFGSFDTSRSGAKAEAAIVAQQFETAQLMPVAVRARLSGELVCDARNEVYREWPRMESGSLGEGYNPWGVALFRTLKTVEPRSASEQAAYGNWLDQRHDREDARADRVHGAEGVIPTPLWIVLLPSALVIFGFMLFFADGGERAIVQATMMGSVAVVITSTLLLLWFLDNPYHRSVSGLRPTAVERTLALLKLETGIASGRLPCHATGKAWRAVAEPARSWADSQPPSAGRSLRRMTS